LGVLDKSVLDLLESYKIQYDPKVGSYLIDESKVDNVIEENSLTYMNKQESNITHDSNYQIEEDLDHDYQEKKDDSKNPINELDKNKLI
jgi:hypothetical protein